MTKALWFRITLSALGVLALALLIWFGGPLIAVAEVRPLESVWVRLSLILLTILVVAGIWAWRIHKRRQAAAELERGIAGTEEVADDASVLQDTMKDALATLRRASKANGDYLYDLPWYVIIGPPGSGKTTALVNSGLKFPLTRGTAPEAIAGTGGTRYCDWWFTEEAVLIDTAGRYTTQDSDPKADRASWLAFLDLLRKNRPKQPINGVLVAISVEDLLTAGHEEITAHANAVRKRLLELHEHLKVDFPVYALFTKADLIAGFMEFLGGLNEAERRQVWGHTFQTKDKTRNMIGEVPPEFDALVERLNEQMPDHLQDEPTPTGRVILFGFPSQVASAKKAIVEFLNRVFEPTRYHSNATLRGFYLTSGTQQGTPIDQLIGALSRSFGAEQEGAAAYSGIGKSYFLTDLLNKVVLGEAGWVSTNRAAVRRAKVLRGVAYAALALAFLGAGAIWWLSFTRNSALVGQTNAAIADYRALAAPVLQEALVADRDFSRILPLLHRLRHMPAGYEVRSAPTSLSATFGLSQRERLQSASVEAYKAGLERLLRSRLILRLEERLEANRGNVAFLYEGLKVYLMLGLRPEAPLDRDLIVDWMRRDWAENLYPGAANARGRQALEEHLVAMLELDDGRPPLVSLNGPLVEDIQRTLARMSVAERAYELLKSQARGASHFDWVAALRGGPDMKVVFEATKGDLDDIRVPFFFTYAGFHTALIDRLGDIGEHVERERWVLGAAGEQVAVQTQYASLFADILKLYTRDFVAAWQQALGQLKLRKLTADRPSYVILAAASAPTSPIKQLLESIKAETQLTRERPSPPPGSEPERRPGTPSAARRVLNRAALTEAERRAGAVLPSSIANPLSELGRLAVDGQLGGGGGAGGGAGGPSPDRFGPRSGAPGANIEALFKHFHVLVEGDMARRPIDGLIQVLSEINQNLALAATNPLQVPAANAALTGQLATLRATSARFPTPFSDMIRNAAGDFEGDATGATMNHLSQALADQVIRVCQQIVTNRYPFARGSDREVPLGDFGRLFGPNGVMDRFFTQNLAPLVDQSKQVWTWRQDSRLARGLSTATLREFQRAAEIRDAFFPTGGVMPSVLLNVTPITMGGDTGTTAVLEINGQNVGGQQGVNAPVNVQWPGAGVGRTAITLMQGGGGFFGGAPQPVAAFERSGAWSLYRMLDAGSTLVRGDTVTASFAVGGRQVSYRFNVNSVLNPLVLPALREFKCPVGI
jgi:type VI secretion system protein ImpL